MADDKNIEINHFLRKADILYCGTERLYEKVD